ncbi:hypothetical protein GNP80_08915 [Aliivibrio fischeri]|uniref:hypothetical protein n=1 Tax=Aliivibrio fischeri TaxID=668 RepID=UPI0012D959C1|nr:hypothetical protein [Aliivibrio fischeri]MUK92562.1 hypothetical protein [Aliivibrio fischeri]
MAHIDPDLLKTIADKLGDGWIYNSTLTNETHYRSILNNRSGLFITVERGNPLAQFKLCIKDPKHKNLVTMVSVGCNLNRTAQSIANDLKNRLLSHSGEAYSKLKEKTEEYQDETAKKAEHEHVINALKCVLNLNPEYDHRFGHAYRIEDKKGSAVAKLKKSVNLKGFRLTLDNLDAEQVIKIMQISNPELFNK